MTKIEQAKHTPGPWKETGNWYLTTSSGTNITCTAISAINQRKVAAVISDTGEIDNWDEMRVNAKLIAAAPELLEACEDLVDLVEALIRYPYPESVAKAVHPVKEAETFEAIMKAKRGINKAKGEKKDV